MTDGRYEIDAIVPELREQLLVSTRAIIGAPPGSGKSTVLPLRLLDEPWLEGRKILLLQPRRIAARNIAFRLSELHGSTVGDTVGYRVRFESCVSKKTRLEVITEGILLRLLQEDSALEEYALVVFDEFHERSLQAELALALTLDAQAALRPDLRIVLMSATLDFEGAQRVLDAPPTLTCEGRAYPVTVEYLTEDPKERIENVLAREVVAQYSQRAGDILAFLPGVQEIRRATEEISRRLVATTAPYSIVPLFGDLPFSEQQRAIMPLREGGRKIILATPIAETSLTIEGVATVVDSGLRNSASFDPAYGLTRYQSELITKDSAEQRRGRAGRLGPGHCVRLWCENTHRAMRDRRTPEILSADLAPLALELCAWGVSDPATLRWIDPPPANLFAHATETLRRLGAIDERSRLTDHGRALHRFGAHPRVASLLLASERLGAPSLGADLAALLEERDPLALDQTRSASIEDRLEALQAHRSGRAVQYGAAKGQLGRIDRTAKEWRRRLSKQGDSDVSAGALLSLAFPDRIARQRASGSRRFLTTLGNGVQLREDDGLVRQEFIVALDARVGAGNAIVRLAAPLSRSELELHHGRHFTREELLEWDDRNDSITAQRVTSLGKMPLSTERISHFDPAARARLLLDALRSRGIGSLRWPPAAVELRQRVNAVRAAYPQAQLPNLTDHGLTETLDRWLGPHLVAISKFEQLHSLDLYSALQQLLSWEERSFVDRMAPSELSLPAGRNCRIDYSSPQEAVLAATVQDLFGVYRTPTIGEGRIPVSVHLLSPARRPVQVTRDLEGFWKTTYQQVKKELKGRYPKHYWPEDPLTAPLKRAPKR